MRRAVSTAFAAAFLLAPTAALAHAGHGNASGLMKGFRDPIARDRARLGNGWRARRRLGTRALSPAGGGRVVGLVPRVLHQSLSGRPSLGTMRRCPHTKPRRQQGRIASITK
jgi:hypothetical protein